jgi:EmrB/QacA subfamily drug resistance transporter
VEGSSRRSSAGLLLIAGAFFMEFLDGTVIATALPQMAHTFHANAVDLNVGMTAYMLTLAVFIPISGWVADRFGSRRVFASAIAVFTLASVLCGISNGLTSFTLARILQGIGGAMMVPVGRLVVLRSTEKKDLIRAIAYLTWPGLAAPIVGPPLGGFITTYANWRWIFFLNVPLGVTAFALTFFLLRNEREEERPVFDWITFLLCGVACSTFVYGLELLGQANGTWKLGVALIAVSVATGAGAIATTRRAQVPLIDLESLKLQTFAVTIFGGSIFRIAISVSPFLLPLMFQIGFGMNAFRSGLFLLALFAGNMGMKSLTTPVLRRFGFRRVLIVNGIVVGVAILLCALLSPRTPWMLVVLVLFVNGLCRSMQFTSMGTLAFVDVPFERMSAANSFASTVQQLTSSMGVAVGALALRMATVARGHAHGTPDMMDFHIAFALVSVLAFAAIFDCFQLPPDAGSITSGHHAKQEPELTQG